MDVRVVDASALAAVLFREPEGEGIISRLDGVRLVAPALLWFEMASVCLIKMRRDPGRRSLLLQGFAMQAKMTIDAMEIDHREVLLLAERLRLTSYDASYLWLASQLDAELVTLDQELARADRLLRPG